MRMNLSKNEFQIKTLPSGERKFTKIFLMDQVSDGSVKWVGGLFLAIFDVFKWPSGSLEKNIELQYQK